MEVGQWNIVRALESARSLQEHIDELPEKDVIAALELESGTRRRHSIIERLIGRAIRLNELAYRKKLTEKYHGTSTIESPDGSGNQNG
jgi:hypothetical protein